MISPHQYGSTPFTCLCTPLNYSLWTKITIMDTNATNVNNPTTRITNYIEGKCKLVNVHYPGFVKNVDKALETLGGVNNIESVISNQKKYLELSFRPNNLQSKAVFSDRDTKPYILLKIITRQEIQGDKIVKKDVIDYNVIGITAVNLKFNKLCDFQYLPLVSETSKVVEDELVYIYNDIIPKHIPSPNWLNTPDCYTMPHYFVPYQFSKLNLYGNHLQFERSKFYEGCFAQKYSDKFKEHQLQQKLTKKDNNKFTKTTMLCRFEDDIPLNPSSQSVEMLKRKGFNDEIINKLKQFFEERPIWSRNAVFYYTGATTEQMKYILPTIAYHYVSGPWRVMWVRFGYDPKSDPKSKLLQTFDYRVRSKGGCKIKIKTKRYSSKTDGSDRQSKFTLGNVLMETKAKTPVSVAENSFLLRPGLIPSARQIFLQYCDVKLPEIENMIARLPAVLPGSTCHWKHGWLPNGFADQCREIVNKYLSDFITNEVRLMRPPPPPNKHATDMSSSSSSSESEESDVEAEHNSSLYESELSEVIDVETVDEINELLQNATSVIEPQPGPSSAL